MRWDQKGARQSQSERNLSRHQGGSLDSEFSIRKSGSVGTFDSEKLKKTQMSFVSGETLANQNSDMNYVRISAPGFGAT